MSVIRDLPEHFKDNCRECSLCGGPASGAWFGTADGGHLASCRSCAFNVLPKLIADATFIASSSYPETENILLRIEKEFWRAVAICRERAVKRQ